MSVGMNAPVPVAINVKYPQEYEHLSVLFPKQRKYPSNSSPSTTVTKYNRHQVQPSLITKNERGKMSKLLERAFIAELTFRQRLTTVQHNFFARLKDDRGDVPGWVLVVLMTTGLVTAIWTIAAPRLTAILKNSLDSMNGIR
jgi:hypothetical protein